MLTSMPTRSYMMQWLPKYREVAHPSYYDNPMRRWDSKMKTKRYSYYSQDPLYFNHDMEHTNGGISVVSEQSKSKEF